SCLFKEVIGVYRQQNSYNHRNKAIFLYSEKVRKISVLRKDTPYKRRCYRVLVKFSIEKKHK
ncbi:hypothetical protein NGA81_10930, partial [Lactococcus formosensis]|uniref:hypothetical protein n=1 Tax=Lactococcus formosensis TaxID=1281486 RepID=UPI0024357394